MALVMSMGTALASAQTGSAGRGSRPSCVASGPVRLAAPDRHWYLGVITDYTHQTLAAYDRRNGFTPADFSIGQDFPFNRRASRFVDSVAKQVATQGAALTLTLYPTHGLSKVTGAVVRQLASRVRGYVHEGVRVFVRYAPEMNGDWFAWGQRPAAYVASFRLVARAIHSRAPGAAMLWAPNYGGGYPYPGGPDAPKPGSADAKALDTNHDGSLDQGDDPYAPYYPGDAYVDWVGMSLYHWGDQWPWGANDLPEAGKFTAQLTGSYDGDNGDDSWVPDFYHLYGVGRHKPVAISETAALYNPDRHYGPSEIQIHRAWWRQIFSALGSGRFSDLRMVTFFDENKYEPGERLNVRWSVTDSTKQARAFRQALPSSTTFAQGRCRL